MPIRFHTANMHSPVIIGHKNFSIIQCVLYVIRVIYASGLYALLSQFDSNMLCIEN